MKEQEFGFVWVNTKTYMTEPFPTERGKAPELRDNTGEGFARGKDTTVIHIKGEVGIAVAFETKLEKGRSKNS